MTKPTSIVQGGEFDLSAVDRELRQEEAYVREGHTARTLVREPTVRIVFVVMKAGARLDEHTIHDAASIHAVSGHVRVRLPDRTVDLSAGTLLVIGPGLAHDVEAVAESAFLLTLARSEHG